MTAIIPRTAGRFWRHTMLLAALLTLAACAGTPTEPPHGTVRVAPGVTLRLPAPATLGRGLEAAQLVTAHYGDQTFVFEGHISATPDRVLLVGLDPMGRKALTVTWTEAGISFEKAPWLPAQVRPDNMIADLVILYWPAKVVRQGLAPSGAVLDTGPRWRDVRLAEKRVIHAEFNGDNPWSASAIYSNLVWGYSLEIQSVEVGP